jgi:hypothetical protein
LSLRLDFRAAVKGRAGFAAVETDQPDKAPEMARIVEN